jgi:hypothetical protein
MSRDREVTPLPNHHELLLYRDYEDDIFRFFLLFLSIRLNTDLYAMLVYFKREN